MNNALDAPRALVVYESMFGNTERIAAAVVNGLRSGGCEATAVEVRSAGDAPAGVDLLVLGAPTHAFSLSRPNTRAEAVTRGAAVDDTELGLREWLASLGTATKSSPPVAAFDTRVSKVRRLPASAGRAIAKLVKHRGYRVVGRPQGFLVEDVDGPLSPGQLDRATDWGRELAGSLTG